MRNAVIALFVTVAGALALAACGGSSSTTTQATKAHAVVRKAKPKPKSLLVRNAKPQPNWRPYTGPVPILVYHELGTPPPSEPYPASTSRTRPSRPTWRGCTLTAGRR